ncbi:hypothetical protein ACWKSP_36715 [Micromonosporaceae bacterium Da 78-11]
MIETTRQIYGIEIRCTTDPRAAGVVDAFFGPPVPPRGGTWPSLRLTVDVVDHAAAPTTEPPHTEEVIAADPIVIDTGGSRCVLDPLTATAAVTFAAADLSDPIVWGRWVFERLTLYLVCRSARLYPLHAGAFVLDGHAIAVSGPTGMGKSTITHAALRRGAEMVGEDILVRDRYDDVAGRLWGYSRALYLSPDRLAESSILDGAVTAAVAGGEKYRVTVPAAPQTRLRPAIVPDDIVFLDRGEATVRPLGVDEAVERCRDDYPTGKHDPAVLAAVEADLRALLGGRRIWELAMSADLDESLDTLLSVLKST